ncbi:MAG: hypothetical protein Q9208_006562 [Pyrenodesmia sp. 3 TL-2023]
MPSLRLQPPRFVCQRTHRHQSARSFTITSSKHLPSLGPESPSFIHVPRPPQPDAPHHPHIKGVLPIPRKIFSGDETANARKISPSYLDTTTPRSSPNRLAAPKPTDPSARRLVEWKARLAEDRRRNLRESLRELKGRKEKSDRWTAARSSAKQKEREGLLSAPTPADEKFTSPSVLQSSLPQRSALPDPDREARIEQKKANYARHAAMKQAERRNALHTLYMNARDFIVTEERLSEAVERAFDPRSKQFENDSREGVNIWNLGYPETVREMLEKASKEEGTRLGALEGMAGYGKITGERMRRLGEELTGGKM